MMRLGMMQMLLAALMGGAGNDLLDYMQTKAYWQLKGVAVTAEAMQAELKPATPGQVAALVADLTGDDEAKRTAAAGRLSSMGMAVMPQLEKAAAAAQGNPEKAGAIQELIGKLYTTRQAGAVRRLMAIRALGELKARPALGVLKGLGKSKALFEADYAAAAIAAIEGKPYKRPTVSARMLAADVWRLPAGCGIAAQFRAQPGGPIDFAGLVKQAGQLPGGMKSKDLIAHATRALVMAAERTGNIRFDSVTAGVAANVASSSGFVVLIGRGKYNAKAVAALISEEGRAKTETLNGLEVLRPDNEVALILPGNDMLVFCTGPNRSEMPLGEVTMAVKTGTGGLKPASDLGKLIKTVDTSQPLWAAATITDAYRKAGPMIAAFKTITLVGKPVKDGQAFTVTGKGSDANLVAAAVKEFTGHIEGGKRETGREIQRGGPMASMSKQMLEFLKTIKTKADGTSAGATATLKGSSLMTAMPLLIYWFGREAPRPLGKDAPPPEDVIIEEHNGPVQRPPIERN